MEQRFDAAQTGDAWRFAQEMLGNPVANPFEIVERSRCEREFQEWLVAVSSVHTKPDPELADWRADVTTVQEFDWDPARHPRRGGPPNAGWFATTGSAGAANGAAGSSTSAAKFARAIKGEDSDRSDQDTTPPRMLELAGAWVHTKDRLDQYRSDLEKLPKRIESELSQLGTGGRYAYVHTQNLAKAQKDLETAKAQVPKLEAQLRVLEKEYHDSGFDDVPYGSWTPGETIISGRGIKEVGDVLKYGGSPAGLKPTGIEYEVALGAASALQLGKAALKAGLATAPSSAPKLATFSTGGKTSGVFRTSAGDLSFVSGRTGPASLVPKATPGFNAITRTHVEGHAAATMRQKGIKEATIYINNPKICLPCQQNLANMLPSGSKLTVVLPDGTSKTFIGNAR
jgi:hypothetical protein